MPIEDIAQEYLKFTDGKETLGDVYQHKFGISLEESNINQNVKMVIVASQMDSGTERIIRFLRNTYLVDINILFFRVYQCGDQRIISRTWFEEDIEELPPESQKNDHGMVNVTLLLAKDIENGKMQKNTVSFLPEMVVGILDP